MKILVVQDWLRSGGTERQSVFLSHAFAAAGHPTTLLTFRPGGSLDRTVGGEVSRRVLQSFDTRLDWFAPGLLRVASDERPAVVLCMGRMANCFAGSLQTRVPQSAVIATMRTGKPLPPLFRRSLRVARHIVANSRDARDALAMAYRIPADKITVIHNSLVFAPATRPQVDARTALRHAHGATADTTVLLCVAMFRPEKKQRELIEIVAGLPDGAAFQLWLAGAGAAQAECVRLARKLGVGDRVRFVGFHRDPSALYAAADVAVHASASESLSNFIIEAQAHGLPAVVYEAQGMHECFVPEHTGWVISRGNFDAFRTRLVALTHESADARASRSAAASAYARATFDPKRQVDAYLDLFARLT